MPEWRRIEAGSRLREVRLGLGLTQQDVVAEMRGMGRHLTDSALSSYESGRRTIDAFMLQDLCLIYGVATEYITLGTHMVPSELKEVFQRVGRAP